MFLERGKQFLYSIHVPYFSIPLTRGRRESRLSTDSLTCNCKGIRNPESTCFFLAFVIGNPAPVIWHPTLLES